GDHLRTTVMRCAAHLRSMPPADAAQPRSAGKWSPKEIIGHLIDSATNNHGRFVRAQLHDSMRFEGYDQDGWVRVQRYADADWMELITLWEHMNLHLAEVMERASPESLHRVRTDHNLHLRAFRPITENRPTTLAWFMEDYVMHLEHHLRQIDAEMLA
ncbi:MAG TPA: DinB family protein, partial [Flavobacteriales bacterium]|nr:DinB family protein [Flavobacteriales bacterium]